MNRIHYFLSLSRNFVSLLNFIVDSLTSIVTGEISEIFQKGIRNSANFFTCDLSNTIVMDSASTISIQCVWLGFWIFQLTGMKKEWWEDELGGLKWRRLGWGNNSSSSLIGSLFIRKGRKEMLLQRKKCTVLEGKKERRIRKREERWSSCCCYLSKKETGQSWKLSHYFCIHSFKWIGTGFFFLTSSGSI